MESGLALQADGWYLRSEIVWEKPNANPESVIDRPVRCHEHIFLLAKSEKYYYDREATKERANGGSADTGKMRYKRTVWPIDTRTLEGSPFRQVSSQASGANRARQQ